MEKVKLWTENIIIVVIISIIIEMIMPEGNSKKYVKVVSGIYLLYVIINPILSLNLDDFNNVAESLIGNETIEISSQTESVAETYVLSLESSIKSQIEELGYSVESVTITLTSDYSDFESVIIKMQSSEYDENSVKQVVLNNFDIDSGKISFA